MKRRIFGEENRGKNMDDRKDCGEGCVLYIPGNDIQIRKFLPVARKLHRILEVVSIAKFKQEGIEEALNAAGIRYERLEELSMDAVRKIIKSKKPSVIVIGNYTEVTPAMFVDVGNELGIPSITLQDGAYHVITATTKFTLRHLLRAFSLYKPQYLLKRLGDKLRAIGDKSKTQNDNVKPRALYGIGNCTKIAVFGEFTKKMLVERGTDSSRVVVVGNPDYDRFADKYSARTNIRKIFGIPENKKIVLLATSDLAGARLWTYEDMEYFVKSVVSEVCNMEDDGVQLIIKIHPREIKSDYDRYLTTAQRTKVIVTKDTNIYDLIDASGAVLTDISSVALDAIAMGKPVGIVNLTGRPYPCIPYPEEYMRKGVALEMRKKEEIRRVVKRLLGDAQRPDGRGFSALLKDMKKSRENFLKEQLLSIDGKSGKRAAWAIEELAEEKRIK